MARPLTLDQRKIRVGIYTPDSNLRYYEDPLNIYVDGETCINNLLANCQIKISNLAQEERDYILTTTSPYNFGLDRRTVRVTVDAGRESTGLRNLYDGQVFSSTVSMPPDVTVTLNCKFTFLGATQVIAISQQGNATVKQVAQQVVDEINRTLPQQNKLSLDFRSVIESKVVNNVAFQGVAPQALSVLRQFGLDVYIDKKTVVVNDKGKYRGTLIPEISSETGMIGIPEITEVGVNVKFLLDTFVQVGSAIKIKSNLYKAANGIFQIYKLRYQIATRDTPFYYIAECKRNLFTYGISNP